MTVGDRIKATRLAADITQTDLGKSCGTSKQTIYKYENNLIANIPMDKVELMAQRLGVTAAYLMGWEEKKSEPTQAPEQTVSDDDIMFALFGGKDEITDAMYDEVKDFAQYVKHRETKKANEHIFVQPSSEDRSLKVASPVLRPTANKEKE